MSEVNERTRAPLLANLITTVVAIVMLIVVVFSPNSFVVDIAGTEILGLVLTFIVVSVAAIAFPYRPPLDVQGLTHRPDSLSGIPVMAIVGVLSLGVYVLFAVVFATTPALGATTTTGKIALIAFVALGVVAYPIVYLLNRRRGLDISLASRELPPE